MFREEPLARPCISLTEPSNRRPKNPYMRVSETPAALAPLGGVLVLANDRLVSAMSSARNTIETFFDSTIQIWPTLNAMITRPSGRPCRKSAASNA
jgi:hypothetical protein